MTLPLLAVLFAMKIFFARCKWGRVLFRFYLGKQFCTAETDDPLGPCRGAQCAPVSKGQNRFDEPRVCPSVCGRTMCAPTRMDQVFSLHYKN